MTSNGESKATTQVVMTLEYDLLTGGLVVGGTVPNINLSLAMLAQATREFEAIERVQRMQQLAAQQQAQRENQRIADAVLKRG